MKQLFLITIVFFSVSSFAQPKWQQKVDTRIDVRLDDKAHFLHASEEFTYTNNSPDTLTFLYIHLWPNAYKNDHTPFEKQQDVNHSSTFYYAKEKDRGYIDSLQFTVNGQSVDFNSTYDAPDIARIDLIKPLLPGQSVKVATPFRVKIPRVFSRMGHTGQAYFISQWFPKPAVYDQKGWHPISYLDQGEFFSEYGSYDVSITLPANYILMATGNCLDDRENNWLDSLSKLPVPSDSAMKASSPSASALETKTVHFHEDNIHDFAWFADKRWIVRKDTVTSPGNNLLVTTYTAFQPEYYSYAWKNGNKYLAETIRHYGKWVGPYPYKTIKAVLGDMHAGGGMEYPTITIIDKTGTINLKTTIIHEAGHNWFYGMLGSNERDHAWMDEGINTFFEQKTTSEFKKDAGKGVTISVDEKLLYYEMVATHTDQAIDQTATNFAKLNYGIDVYYKTTLMLNWLEQYMGDDFEKGMKDYYNTWHYHHPYPEDFRLCMQRNTAKSLDWFFDVLLTTDEKIDFKIAKGEKEGDHTLVSITNNTGLPVPVLIDACESDSITGKVWIPPFTGDTVVSMPGTAWNKLKIDPVIADGKRDNNVYKEHALFHHFGLQLRPLLGLNQGEKDKIFFAPAMGDNQYDGYMLGMLLHNLTIPENRFRFAVAPMYGFGSKAIVGTGSVGYLWYPNNLKEIMLQCDAKTFHNDETQENLNTPLYGSFLKVAPSLNFTFKQSSPLSPVTRSLLFKEYNITEQNINSDTIMSSLTKPGLKSVTKFYGLVRYRHRNDRTYNPFNYTLEGQAGADFAKLTAEGNIRIDYNAKNKSLYIRAFIGDFIPISSDPAVYSRYELNASYSGIDDYLYDGTYLGRNSTTGLGAHQVSMQEGGFKVPVFNQADQSESWMATLSLETDLPLRKWPIRLFFDAGLIPNVNPSTTNTGFSTLLYEGGVDVHLIKDVISVYLPIIMSSDFQNYLVNTYGKRNFVARSLSFTLEFQNINWLRAPSRLLKSAVN